ncbi:MAG TPA: DNA-directed RNA polymerase subunit beta' [Patescibacteria group bacterium]|nr:DNA-directed RNA polymerase subunit beta' [Patescibacteria group bacterium]
MIPRDVSETIIKDFKSLRVSLASPETVKGWSHGEITKPETINYRTLKPEKDGLFDERIFGPSKDWECYCGKYKRIRYKGVICDKCGVEVTQSKVRRERMGHISLSAAVAHVWFFKGAPSKLSLILDMTPRSLDAVIYFAQYLVTSVDLDKKDAALKKLSSQEEVERRKLEDVHSEQVKALEAELKEEVKKLDIKDKEHKAIVQGEMELKSRQKASQLKDELVLELTRLQEVFKALREKVENLTPLSLLSEDEYYKLLEYDVADFFTVGMGAEALEKVLKEIDLNKLAADLKEEVATGSGQKQVKATKRLHVIEGLRLSGVRPEWMIMHILPVIPPDLRPMVQLSGGRFATSDLNDLYRRVINRNNRLRRLTELGAPEIILRNEKRMLQEAVDSLIDSTQRPGVRATNQQELRSISDMLKGKQGRFRQNLLGKRVDYSGRSVIIVGPELALNQCRLPKEMALELFRPFVLRELILQGYAPNVKSARHVFERRGTEVWDILEEVTKGHPVLLNRAPTLHRLGIQAFYPVLTEGKAIAIHPSVCVGYGADFDGDQMAVHVPLSKESIDEAINLMMSTNNLRKPSDGGPVMTPKHDSWLGIFYLTALEKGSQLREDSVLGSEEEAIFAYMVRRLRLRQLIKVRVGGEIIETTVGRILFNEILPAKFRFENRQIKGSDLVKIVDRSIRELGKDEAVRLIDQIKNIGFRYATRSGISMSSFDALTIPEKPKLLDLAEKQVEEIEKNWRKGLLTKTEKRNQTQAVWSSLTAQIDELTWQHLGPYNTVRIFAESGARGSRDQVKQIAGMRGLVADPTGKVVELPTKSNFREGLNVFEYFTSSRGARKGLVDKALKTAEAGYLTRRLVDVAHDVLIRTEDCGTKEGITVTHSEDRTATFPDRLTGRVTALDVTTDRGRVVTPADTEITEEVAKHITEAGILEVTVRSPLTCQAKYGICARCYGWDLSTKSMVKIGTPAGVIAAQSIGEPGTQLTMRTFHLGGIVGLDITQGLPRVEELFEARVPKTPAVVSEIAGKVEVVETEGERKVRIKAEGGDEKEYPVIATAELLVKDKDLVAPGQPLTAGHVDIKQILEIKGVRAAQEYIISEIQRVYESQGVSINDKHFESIVRKMSEKVRVESKGDSPLLPGELVDRYRFNAANAKVLAEGGEPATATLVLLGITRAALFTESFLSAASFQETTSVLTDAATTGKVDHLIGLKENVIIGRLIPTGERARLE